MWKDVMLHKRPLFCFFILIGTSSIHAYIHTYFYKCHYETARDIYYMAIMLYIFYSSKLYGSSERGFAQLGLLLLLHIIITNASRELEKNYLWLWAHFVSFSRILSRNGKKAIKKKGGRKLEEESETHFIFLLTTCKRSFSFVVPFLSSL